MENGTAAENGGNKGGTAGEEDDGEEVAGAEGKEDDDNAVSVSIMVAIEAEAVTEPADVVSDKSVSPAEEKSVSPSRQDSKIEVVELDDSDDDLDDLPLDALREKMNEKDKAGGGDDPTSGSADEEQTPESADEPKEKEGAPATEAQEAPEAVTGGVEAVVPAASVVHDAPSEDVPRRMQKASVEALQQIKNASAEAARRAEEARRKRGGVAPIRGNVPVVHTAQTGAASEDEPREMRPAGVEAMHGTHDAGAETAGARRAEAERAKEAQRAAAVEAAREAGVRDRLRVAKQIYNRGDAILPEERTRQLHRKLEQLADAWTDVVSFYRRSTPPWWARRCTRNNGSGFSFSLGGFGRERPSPTARVRKRRDFRTPVEGRTLLGQWFSSKSVRGFVFRLTRPAHGLL